MKMTENNFNIIVNIIMNEYDLRPSEAKLVAQSAIRGVEGALEQLGVMKSEDE